MVGYSVVDVVVLVPSNIIVRAGEVNVWVIRLVERHDGLAFEEQCQVVRIENHSNLFYHLMVCGLQDSNHFEIVEKKLQARSQLPGMRKNVTVIDRPRQANITYPAVVVLRKYGRCLQLLQRRRSLGHQSQVQDLILYPHYLRCPLDQRMYWRIVA
jgi:hypothetical protein